MRKTIIITTTILFALIGIVSAQIGVTENTPPVNWNQIYDGNLWNTGAHSYMSPAPVIYDGKIYLIGGYSGTTQDWVFNSDNGINWTEITISAGFGARNGQKTLVYDNKIWVLGGSPSGGTETNDVWYTTNGINWTQATNNASWGARAYFGAVVYDNKMWVYGGYDENEGFNAYNDVWYSTDGTNWILATNNANWSPRWTFGTTVFDGRIYLLGGKTADGSIKEVWYTTDGTNWYSNGNATWDAREYGEALTFDNKMWIIGGENLNDIWYTTDGTTWVETNPDTGWATRYDYGVFTFDNRMWMVGGDSTPDIWQSEQPTPPPFPNGDEQTPPQSFIDTLVKIFVGLGAIAVLVGMIIGAGLIAYFTKPLWKK